MRKKQKEGFWTKLGVYVGIAIICAVLGSVVGAFWHVFIPTPYLGKRDQSRHRSSQRNIRTLRQMQSEAIYHDNMEAVHFRMMVGAGIGAVAGGVGSVVIARRMKES